MKKFILALITSLALCGFVNAEDLTCPGSGEAVVPPTVEQLAEMTIDIVSATDAYAQSKAAKVFEVGPQAESTFYSFQGAIAQLKAAEEVNEEAVDALAGLLKEAQPIYNAATAIFMEGMLRARLADLTAKHAASDAERLKAATGFCEAAVLFETAAEALTEVNKLGDKGRAVYEEATAEPNLEA
jgi:hypothetical protein